ncbi:hypothetical protein BH24ACT3_BH24ACT3_18510 [soil metagenome]
MSGPDRGLADGPDGLWFRVGLAVGLPVMGFGVAGVLRDLPGEAGRNWVTFLVGADLFHDALIVPVVAVVGLAVARIGGLGRAALQAGLIGTAAVLAVGAIPLLGLGGAPDNPTIRPLDYATSTATAVALVWGAVAVVGGTSWLRRRAGRRRRGAGVSPAQPSGSQAVR